jgi:hypothetical protein
MTSAELLVDAFGRIREVVHQVGDGLTPKQLAFRVDPGGQLDRLAGVAPDPASRTTIWPMPSRPSRSGSPRAGWKRFGLPFHPRDAGYGHRADEVASMQVDSGEGRIGACAYPSPMTRIRYSPCTGRLEVGALKPGGGVTEPGGRN